MISRKYLFLYGYLVFNYTQNMSNWEKCTATTVPESSAFSAKNITRTNTRGLKNETCNHTTIEGGKSVVKKVEHGKVVECAITEEFKTDRTTQRTFASVLQDALDSETRNEYPLANAELKCNMELNTNKTTPKHNVGGNIDLRFDIPCTDNEKPNYVEMILSNTNVLESYPVLRTIISIFTSPDMLSFYYFNKDMNTTNSVPAIDLSKNLSTSTVSNSFGWNINRNYTKDTAKAVLNYHAYAINNFIDYILKNDITQANASAQLLWRELFGTNDANEPKVYAHAVNTLLLPSLVNYFASAGVKRMNPDASVKNNKLTDYKFSHSQAISYAGYVPVGCEFFPIQSSEDIGKMTFFNESKNKISCSWDVNAAYNFNSRWSGSEFNHPLIKTNRGRNSVMDAPVITQIDYMKNITLNYSGTEKYKWTDSVQAMNKITDFATQHIGTRTQNSRWGLITDYAKSKEITTQYSEVSEEWGGRYYSTSCYAVPNDRVTSCQDCWIGSDDCESHNNAGLSGHSFTERRVFDENSSGLKAWGEKELKKGPQIGNDSYYINNITYIAGNKAGKTVIDTGVWSTYIYTLGYQSFKQSGSFFCASGPSKTYTTCKKSDKTIGDMDSSLVPMNGTTKVLIKYDHKHNGTMQFYILRGSFYLSSTNFYVETRDTEQASLDAAKNHLYSICLFKTTRDLVCLSDYTYLSWLYIASSMVNTDKVIKEIRKYACENPHLLLSAKCNSKFGNHIREKAATKDYMYFNIPISTMVVRVPNSEVIPHKFYVPGLKVIDSSTSKANTRNTITGLNVNTMNRVEVASTNNYLDLIMKGLIDCAYTEGTFDGTDVFCVLLPSRGSQLFEVIDKSIATLLPTSFVVKHAKYTDSKSELYSNNPKIVFSSFDFKNNETTKVLLDKYVHVNTVSAPMFIVKKNAKRNVFECEIRAKTDSENFIYVYVSKDKGAEFVSTADNRTVKTVVNKNVRITYNGVDANITPMCLKKKISF